MIIVADTSGLFAAFDEEEEYHQQAAEIMHRETLLISPLVISELDHLMQRDHAFGAALQVTDALLAHMIEGRYQLAEIKHIDLDAAQSVRKKYEGLQLDVADAVGVALAHKYRTDQIFTRDMRDFRAITPLTPGFSAFRLLPADL